jgi:hypothetical protein
VFAGWLAWQRAGWLAGQLLASWLVGLAASWLAGRLASWLALTGWPTDLKLGGSANLYGDLESTVPARSAGVFRASGWNMTRSTIPLEGR